MHKFTVSIFITAALLVVGAQTVFARSYYSFYDYDAPYVSGCVDIAGDLSYGARNSEVLQLQRFLVAQNYPGGGAWMITGYFGAATSQAVRNFQQTQGLTMTGTVDPATRETIARVSCHRGSGNAAYDWNWNAYSSYQNQNPIFTSYPYNYTNQYSYSYPYSYGGCGTYYSYYPCTNSSIPHLSSLSVTTAAPGATITVYGSGFDASNTVYIGGATLPDIASFNGTTLTFIVPVNVSDTISITVGNSRGTSNALTLATTAYSYSPATQYPYPCGYLHDYNCPPRGGPISISYLSPASGGIGTSVTVYGAGFTATDNSVRFGNGIIGNLRSFDGDSVTFTIPSTLSGYGYQPIGLGTYDISVSSSYGATSNTLPFTITSL